MPDEVGTARRWFCRPTWLGKRRLPTRVNRTHDEATTPLRLSGAGTHRTHRDDPSPSQSAGRVVVVIAYRDLDGDLRLSAEEEAEVQRVASARHLPASTLVRSWILERLDRERSA